MKKTRIFTALFSAMAITLCGMPFNTYAEDEEKAETPIKISFNITDDMTPGPKVNMELFEDMEIYIKSLTIPRGTFKKDNLILSGWTVNGIDGFIGGDVYIIGDDETEVVFEPVWYDQTNRDYHTVSYDLTYRDEEVEYPEWLKNLSALKGQIITPNYTTIDIEKAYTNGLTVFDGYELSYGRRFIMPDEDVVIKPKWSTRVNFTFLAGDVDRLNGGTVQTFPKSEGSTTDLPASDRFSRNGFDIVGWLSDYDGETYKPLDSVVVPDVDVNFTAVWEARTYNVVFSQGNGGKAIKVEGKTDENIICPEPDITVEGKYFAGWKDENGDIYPAGSEYTIPGAKPGLGISLSAVWNSGEAPTTTATTTSSTETTTTTTAAKSDIAGDANEDGKVNMADATLIVQHVGNKDKYKLTEQGEKNADVDGKTGITGTDALSVQKYIAKIITALPENSEPQPVTTTVRLNFDKVETYTATVTVVDAETKKKVDDVELRFVECTSENGMKNPNKVFKSWNTSDANPNEFEFDYHSDMSYTYLLLIDSLPEGYKEISYYGACAVNTSYKTLDFMLELEKE